MVFQITYVLSKSIIIPVLKFIFYEKSFYRFLTNKISKFNVCCLVLWATLAKYTAACLELYVHFRLFGCLWCKSIDYTFCTGEGYMRDS